MKVVNVLNHVILSIVDVKDLEHFVLLFVSVNNVVIQRSKFLKSSQNRFFRSVLERKTS